MTINKKRLLASLALCFAAEGLGGLFTARSVGTWYLTLQKPEFTPPGWLFGPVWTLLYFLMGLSFYLIWNARDTHMKKSAIVVFAIQLILNVSWSGAFFGMRSIIGGLIIIVALWLAIVLTMYLFRQISRPAATMLFPYLAWVSFASILNYELWRLNL